MRFWVEVGVEVFDLQMKSYHPLFWRLKLISTQVAVEVEVAVELGNIWGPFHMELLFINLPPFLKKFTFVHNHKTCKSKYPCRIQFVEMMLLGSLLRTISGS